MPAPYPSYAVANRLLDLAEEEGRPLTPAELQKILFFAHGLHLAVRDEPLVREPFAAWKYGPVQERLYHEFKEFGKDPIATRIAEWQGDGFQFSALPEDAFTPVENHPSSDEVIREAWNIYKHHDGNQLISLTHRPDGPWHRIWHGEGGKNRRSAPIDDRVIRNYFVHRLHRTGGG